MRLPATLAGSYQGRRTPGAGNGWGVCAMAYGTHAFTAPLIDLWEGNTCIAQSSEKFFDFNGCNVGNPTDGASKQERKRCSCPHPLSPPSTVRQHPGDVKQRLLFTRRGLQPPLRLDSLDPRRGAGKGRRRWQQCCGGPDDR